MSEIVKLQNRETGEDMLPIIVPACIKGGRIKGVTFGVFENEGQHFAAFFEEGMGDGSEKFECVRAGHFFDVEEAQDRGVKQLFDCFKEGDAVMQIAIAIEEAFPFPGPKALVMSLESVECMRRSSDGGVNFSLIYVTPELNFRKADGALKGKAEIRLMYAENGGSAEYGYDNGKPLVTEL